MNQTTNNNLTRGFAFLQQPIRDPVRLTALLYLRDALRTERYEECSLIIQIAMEFGATKKEIQWLLEDSRRKPVV